MTDNNKSKKYKTVLIDALTGMWLLLLATLLTLAVNQTIWLTRLYRISVYPGANLDNMLRPDFFMDMLVWITFTVVLFVLVFRYRRRLLTVTLIAGLLFAGFNLYSGRHVLPYLLVWPFPVTLAEQYAQALESNDPDAVLELSGQSAECQAIMTGVFQKDQIQLSQKVDNDRPEISFQKVSIKNITTFYDKPWTEGFVMMQPVPGQIAAIMVETENGQTLWLDLKMDYTPFVGTRYLCGQSISD